MRRSRSGSRATSRCRAIIRAAIIASLWSTSARPTRGATSISSKAPAAFPSRKSIERMSEALRPATHARHYAEPPQQTEADGTRHWITRAANFVTVVSEAPGGALLERNNPDEYMVLLPPGTEAVLEAGGERVEAK